MKSEELSAVASLIIGSVFIVLAAYSLRNVPHNYMLSMIALAMGYPFVIWALGTLLPKWSKGPETRKSTIIAFSGAVLASIGGAFLGFILAIGIIVPFLPSNWWVYALVGMPFFICGVVLIFQSRTYLAVEVPQTEYTRQE